MQSSIVSCSCDGKGGGFGVFSISTLLAVDSVRESPLECGSSTAHACHAPIPTPAPDSCCRPRQTVQDCTATLGGAMYLETGGTSRLQVDLELVDCRILRCHATKYGGCLTSSNLVKMKMTRGTIAGCSAKTGGGIHAAFESSYALVDVLITECVATGDKEDDGGGGIVVEKGAILTMSGGSIRDCVAQGGGGGGGLRVADSASQVRLSGMALQGCIVPSDGGCMSIQNGDVSLVNVSLECGVENPCQGVYALLQQAGTLHVERVHVGGPNPKLKLATDCAAAAVGLWGNSEWSDSTITDSPRKGLVIGSGTHAVVRTSFVRSYIDIASGILTMTDSHMTGFQQDADDARKICLHGSGTMVLRNTTLHNCSSRYINLQSASAATNFQAELLTLKLSCEEEPSKALIKIDGAFTAPLSVRGLRVVAPAACSSTNFSVFSDNVRPVNCSEYNYAPCDATATCTEVPPLPAVPTLKTVDCSCEGGAAKAATSRALAPYGFNPSSIGLPDKPVDYCVRPSTVTPQTTTKAAQVRGSHAPPPPAAAHRSRHVRRLPLTSVASVWRR